MSRRRTAGLGGKRTPGAGGIEHLIDLHIELIRTALERHAKQ
jgi:hypothetical protein